MKILFVAKRYGEGQGIMALSSFLKINNFDVHYVDSNRYDEIAEAVKNIKPDILAYSTTSGEYNYFKSINVKLKKEFNIFTVIGGPHATFFGKQIIEDVDSGFDGACVGEGEEALLELCEAIRDKKDYFYIRNWIFRNGDDIIVNKIRPYIEDLDTMPIPDFNLSSVISGNEIAGNERMLVWLHRGCPYDCTYCMNHVLRKIYKGLGKVIRVPSPKRCIEIIKARMSLPGNKGVAILFKDDTFGHDLKWLKEFCELYKKEIKLPWAVHLYPAMITEERILMMKDAGCTIIETAVETGNEERRRNLLKRRISNEDLISAIKMAHSHGYCLRIQNILLLPGETWETAWETFNINVKCDSDLSTSSLFQPYPGIELTRIAVEQGYLNAGEFENNIPLDLHWKSVLKFNNEREVRRITNLHHLFTFGVYFKIFKPLVYLMTYLPTNKFIYHIDNIAWEHITHRSSKLIRHNTRTKLKVFCIFVYNFFKYKNIKATFVKEYNKGIQRSNLEKVF